MKEPLQEKLRSLIETYSQGQLQKTLDEASQLLQQFPNSVKLHNISGRASKGLGQLDAAVDAYNKALTIQPNYAEAYNNLGFFLTNKRSRKKLSTLLRMQYL